ncbi:MAG: hypothetical protein ACI3WR_04695 [Oscillospiraceae bacterium]
MKKLIALAAALCCLLALAGCGGDPGTDAPETQEPPQVSKLDAIPFREDQLYAVAFLGYQEIEDLAFYAESYLDDQDPPIHYLSDGEYYLVIPRYTDMSLRLYKGDMETMEQTLIYEEAACRPFIIQCNVSDIFPDASVSLTRGSETVEFSPYLSLKDGSVQVGERGLDLTRADQ